MRDALLQKRKTGASRWLRDDLPQMRWPLVLLSVVVACLSAGLACSFQGAALLLSIPFLVLSVTAYSALILLWRHMVALAVTGGIALAVLFCGGHWLTAVGASASLLAISYTYACRFLAKDTRFVRVAATASAVGICGLLLAMLYVGWHWGSLRDAIDALCAYGRELLLARLQDSDTIVLPSAIDRFLGQLAATLPAIGGMGAILFAGLCDGAMQLLFWLLDCTDYFTPDADKGVTSPRSFGILYGVLLFLVLTTDSTASPHLYTMLANCHWVFALPCFWVGLTRLWQKLRDLCIEHALYHHAPSPLLMVTCFVVIFGILGLSTAFTLTAIVGAGVILRRA